MQEATSITKRRAWSTDLPAPPPPFRPSRGSRFAGAGAIAAAFLACARTVPSESSTLPPPPAPARVALPDASGLDGLGDAALEAAPTVTVWSPPPAASIDGPHEELSLAAGRPIYYAMPRGGPRPLRLVAHLHGMCGPPSYACGKWIGAGTELGAMVCPTGNARCGDSLVGPPSWEAPTWMELVSIMDKDLESAAAKVERKHPGSLRKEGAVLTGYSRGAYAAPVIARLHPNRWRYLVLIEANVSLSAASLKSAGVRAVALVAGEQGTEIAGLQRTQAELERAAFPSKLFVMRRTGHLYSEDMEQVMHEALAFVVDNEE